MEAKCPECKEKFEIDKNEYEEGDRLECPECSASLHVKVVFGKFKLSTEREALYDYDEVDFAEE